MDKRLICFVNVMYFYLRKYYLTLYKSLISGKYNFNKQTVGRYVYVYFIKSN